MNTINNLKQMCHTLLSVTDIKAICTSRGFPQKVAGSRAVFESYFLSDIGLERVFSGLKDREIVLLHLLKLENQAVGIDFFESIGNDKPDYGHSTFTQRYTPVFKTIQQSLIRKGILLMTETGFENTRMERLQFQFPKEFEPYLSPPLSQIASFQEEGDVKQEATRSKLMEFLAVDSGSPGSSSAASKVSLVRGILYMGPQPLNLSLLRKWQRQSWNEKVWKSQKKYSEKLKSGEIRRSHYSEASNAMNTEKKAFPDTVIYALSQLSPGEWVAADALSPLLKATYFGTEPPDATVLCETGWHLGCLAKLSATGKNYYRLPEKSGHEPDPSKHLKVKDSTLSLDIRTIPYETLFHIASISTLEVAGKQVIAVPDLVRLGRSGEAFWKHPLTFWLKENAPLFAKTMAKVESRKGKLILHENLLLAKISNLSLKVQIQKKISDPSQIVQLPNGFIAFPPKFKLEIYNLVKKSGFVVKTISSYD